MTQNTAVADRNSNALNLPVVTAIGGTDITAGQGRAAFLPTSMGEAMELAKLMAAGNFVPPHLRNKPGDCLAVVMQSARWGMDPFAVASKSYFVNDRMAYEAQLVNAVVNSSNVLDGRLKVEWSGEGNTLKCLVSGRIKGDPDIKTREVKLATIRVRNSPLWQADPEQQIGYFATRAWARLHAPEVLLGVYTPEEIEAIEPRNSAARTDAQQRLSSDMLAQQAGVTVEQAATVEQIDTVDAEIEEISDGQFEADEARRDRLADDIQDDELSEAAQQTLNDIDGPLDHDQADDGPDPRGAIADGIIAAVDKCSNVIDLQQLRSRESANIEALPEELAGKVKRAFKNMMDALQGPRAGQS